MKAEFLNNEIWILTFGGGFQRANVYKDVNISSKDRRKFRDALRSKIETIVDDQYYAKVSQENHLENIHSIVDFSKTEKFDGTNIPINFGVAQKLLNLYLKYQWCRGVLTSNPPHFPVDRLIQVKLQEFAKDMKISKIALEPWTQFEDEKHYMAVIDFAELVRVKKFSKLSLAELELKIFSRRKDVVKNLTNSNYLKFELPI